LYFTIPESSCVYLLLHDKDIVDRGPADERNIKGVVMNVNEHGGYRIGTKVGQIKGYMSRNQVQFVANATLNVSEVPASFVHA
jgi:hypothetical protein